MANYTIELSTLFEDPSFKLFDFEYEYYINDSKAKAEFEQKFIDHYLFHEIGHETVFRFKHNLKIRLRETMKIYKERYETELEVKRQNINFLINKDYTETYQRNTSKDYLDERLNINDITNTNDIKTTTTDKGVNLNKTSDLDNGVADINLSSGNLTSVSKDEADNTNIVNGNINTTNKTTMTEQNKITDTNNEDYILIGKGNIGVTSSATLLDFWRASLINIDLEIIEDCHDLFMLVY